MFSRCGFSTALRQVQRGYTTSRVVDARRNSFKPYLLLGAGLCLGGYGYLSFSQKRVAGIDSDCYTPLSIQEIRDVNHDSKIYKLAYSDQEARAEIPVSSSVYVKDDSMQIMRPFTPISSSDSKGYLELLIKLYPDGSMSQFLKDRTVGDVLEVRGPIVNWEYQANAYKAIGMVAGGSGITPMYQIIRGILQNPEDNTRVSLIYANRSEEDILLRQELESLAKLHPKQFTLYFVVDKAPETREWSQGVGFVTREMISQHLPKPAGDVKILVCGPDGMMRHISGPRARDWSQGGVSGLLKELGYSAEQVYKF
ncbi:putative NADH-cytochrome b5 reductase [Basidiobolus meristosporus CBS 931.73]|uniref:NADH-cytochrome b5 reductase n=1 Tax=Basidiobolus meristosporus CBS 931.73 TaxID=1314790 RepID=A0A1Y1XSW0_9FUNG|nr:putative NADH-cytochrome b5 reductase [Basidiobolus meristosporus CBS 931.73]|eukprot:ORX88775.1 putative NADH-cytochrome b5 reductase [Basidiobolus meristosporus CBS 931.73]